ncbi:SseB family protein [Aestuariirhabdus litorea]|uniref:SseB family protein n=1 Tax=Aestuariirhabdus litorea TaxID=2528527 RepID=A0A3P3VR97_9GAMM|nr:SseB family protein [Aestuariirhabdus litorea]RRJ84049.1 SseB family protein [Aestuariirhabdus litorea]RWW97269.1 SseB family protein [Endozoicomonadaceae bacterium GTF-13]
MTLIEALQARAAGDQDSLDAVLECLVIGEIQLLSLPHSEEEEPQLLQLEVSPGEGALALFSSADQALEMARQLQLECAPLAVPGYWPLLELDSAVSLVIDPGTPHNLVLPAAVTASLQPVIRALLEADS